MRVQHNIAALNSYRNFSTNNSKLNKNLEKLSTGYKINRAGDDAAGLAISEKMRAQISGIDGATKNAKDGISLIQTAEGALTEVHDMLNRMTTLAEQSANGTYDDEVDRVQLQKEVDALKSEIDRIADSTNYNGLKLLDGSLSEKSTTTIQEAENTGKQIVTIKTGEGTSEIGGFNVDGFKAATKAEYTTAAIAPASAGYDSVQINFKDKNGEEQTLTLSTKNKIASGTPTADQILSSDVTLDSLVDSLSGESNVFSISGLNADELDKLESLRDAFTFSKDGTGIKFTAKEPGSKAEITRVGFANNTGFAESRTAAAAAAAAASGVPATIVASKPEGYQVTVGDAVPTSGQTLTIGGRTYEFNNGNNVGSNSDGVANTVVRIGDNHKETMSNLVDALKADGIDATDVSVYNSANNNLAANEKAVIRFTDASQISESQSGANISSSTDHLAIVDQAASKQEATITAVTTTGTSSTFRIRYTDAGGEIREKTFDYTSDIATASNNASAIVTALKNDSELNDLFDITQDTTNRDEFSINTKVEGNVSGQFLGMDSESYDAGIGNVSVTQGKADGKVLTMKSDGGANNSTYNMQSGDTVTVNGKTFQFARDLTTDTGDNIAVLIGSDGAASLNNLSKALEKEGITNVYDNGKITLEDRHNIAMEEVTTVENTSLSLQIGDTGESFNKMSVSVSDMHSASIGIGDVDISTQEGATAALDQIKNAVNFVSDVRGSLGALQNRLDHTINNLGVMKENIQNAESLIRDTDVAEEMMTYTKNNILNQSAQAMLAQANQLPQGVLQLLG